jgi:hypothetical protein
MRYKGVKGKCWEEVKRICRSRSTNCFTCTATDLASYNLHSGHFLPVAIVGSNNQLSWDLGQIRTQCGHCNGAGQGMQVEFRRHLVKELGEAAVLEFERRRWIVDKVTDWGRLLQHLKKISK